jgi:hypothetical protein
VLGEWGGPYTGTTAAWEDALVSYLASIGSTSNFMWCLNADGDVRLFIAWCRAEGVVRACVTIMR